jgi:hypothetical protein
MKFTWFIAVTIAMSALLPARANLIVNGGFETGDITGWDGSGAVQIFAGSPPYYTQAGNYAAGFSTDNPSNPPSTLYQTIPTTPGDVYQLSYWVNPGRPNPNSFEVLWGGALIPGSVLTNIPPPAIYYEYSFDLTATAKDTTVEFEVANYGNETFLDSISVNPVPDAAPTLVLLAFATVSIALFRNSARPSLTTSAR